MATVPHASPAEMPPRVEIMSADDWLALPDARQRCELVAGRLTSVLPTDLRYDLIAADLSRAIGRATSSVEPHGMIALQTGFVVNAPDEYETVLVPALAFISAERLACVPPVTSMPAGAHASALLRVAPDLVAEIASPGQREPEIAERVLLWHSAGVRLVWVVWPARRQVDVWTRDTTRTTEAAASRPRTLSAHDTLDGGEVLTGFACTIAYLFL